MHKNARKEETHGFEAKLCSLNCRNISTRTTTNDCYIILTAGRHVAHNNIPGALREERGRAEGH
jgi:hypothetical protein